MIECDVGGSCGCSWIGWNRGLAKDFENILASARAFLYAASVMLLARRIARAS